GFRQVRTPGNHFHVERSAIAGHAASQPSKTDDAKRLAGKAHTNGNAALKTACPHSRVGDRDGASGGDQQAKGQFSGRKGSARAAARGVADNHALAGTSRKIQGRDIGSGDADHAQFGETAEERRGKGGALPERVNDNETPGLV